MSSSTVGWVFDNSPYRGAMFAMHLAVGDIVNDTHGYELWASALSMAKKARVSERSARDCLDQMVSDGLLTVLSERPGETTRYRFEMPANPTTTCTRYQPPATVAPLQPVQDPPATTSGDPLQPVPGTPATVAPKLKEPEQNARGTQVAPRTLVGFDAFWRAFPRREGERDARKAWRSAIQRANPADIIAGAQRYADDPNRDEQYTKTPFKWLEGDCWKDEPRRNGKRRAKGTSTVLSWLGDQDNGGERRELNA